MTMINDTGLGLARRLVLSRVAADLDQAQIARALGVARTTVSAWELGRTEPSATNFVRWAQITRQPLEWLAEGITAETATAPAEAEADAGLSQHSVRPKGLEPLTFWSVVVPDFWTPARASSWEALTRQLGVDAESTNRVGL